MATAKDYLTKVQERSGERTAAAASLLSYETSPVDDSLNGSIDESESDDSFENPPPHPRGWKGLNSRQPLPSTTLSSTPPTRTFEADFIPDPEDPYSLRHSEYGYDDDPAHRHTSQYKEGNKLSNGFEEPSIFMYFNTFLSYACLILIGHMRDFFGKLLLPSTFAHLKPSDGYAPLFSDFDSFYTRRLKTRVDDCFSRPVTGVPGRCIMTIDRVSDDHNHTFTYTGETTRALNISSYNYLGFAQTRGACADQADRILQEYGVSCNSSAAMGGTMDIHVETEALIAKYLGTEDAIMITMGFATNSTTLPILVDKGCLVISDELNHSSIRFGARLSGAMIRQFKHNDMADLETLLRECISQGQPRTHRPWRKILLVVEGLYSMEGTFLNLPRILELKEIYKFYLYVDEAHSIGAIGPNGRGICDYFGISPTRVDICMGTLTKSFGAEGGYIAGKRELIEAIRRRCHGLLYAESMPPPIVAQVQTSISSILGLESVEIAPRLSVLPSRVIDGVEGRDRLRRLAFNCRYLTWGLRELGFLLPNHIDSPVVPLMVFLPGRFALFSRKILERYKIVVVIAAYPATPIPSARMRFCLSSAHTKADLDYLLRAIDDIGGSMGLKLSSKRPRMTIDEVIAHGVETCKAVVD